MKLNRRLFNPVGFHLLKLLRDPAVRLIILYGGSSSGKSYSVAQCSLLLTCFDGENTMVMRKVGASIGRSIYEDFKVAARQMGIMSHLRFVDSLRRVTCVDNGARVDFAGLDDPEKIKGISNYKRVVMDEWSEFDSEDFKQVRKRLRGKPGQQIITTFNPIKETHWIKQEVFDAERWHDVPTGVEVGGVVLPPELTAVKSMRMNEAKSILNPRTGGVEVHAPDTVAIQTTYLNNFWVVGSPDGRYGYYDEQCIADFERDRLHDPDYYNVYALGEWGVIRTGSEFFGSFNRAAHCKPVAYDPSLPVHISVDSNVLPYITCTYWQAEITPAASVLRQLGETCAANPDNTVRRAARLVARRLHGWGAGKVFLHGDASTRASNNIDEGKRSFLDLFLDTLQGEGVEVEDCVGASNPPVAMSGEFVNAILDRQLPGLAIEIGEGCAASVEDYLSVQKDANGAILKTRVRNKATGQSYEEHGHISDTFRYAVCDIMREQFMAFSNRRKRNLYARDGFIRFYNPGGEYSYDRDVLYVTPNAGGKCVMVLGKLCGDRWHVADAVLRETASTEEMAALVEGFGSSVTVVECGAAYFPFVRGLRKSVRNVRVLPEGADVDRRIAATSDFVRSRVYFSEERLNTSAEYSRFMTALLDYNKDGSGKEASAALSGFVAFVAKSFPAK